MPYTGRAEDFAWANNHAYQTYLNNGTSLPHWYDPNTRFSWNNAAANRGPAYLTPEQAGAILDSRNPDPRRFGPMNPTTPPPPAAPGMSAGSAVQRDPALSARGAVQGPALSGVGGNDPGMVYADLYSQGQPGQQVAPPQKAIYEVQKPGQTPPYAYNTGATPQVPQTPLPPGMSAGRTMLNTTGQAGNESRGMSQTGLDPRLDQAFAFALQQALSRFGNPQGNTFYSGPTVAGLTPDELAAQQLLRLNAMQAGGVGGQGLDFLGTMLQNASNPGQSASLQAAIDATLRDVSRQATDPGGLLSNIRNEALSSGSFGGTRQGVAEGVAAGRIADSLGRTSAEMRMAGRNADINAGMNAMGQLPNIVSGLTLPATLLSGVGAQNRNMQQAYYDDNLRRWGYDTTQGDVRLQNLLNMLNGIPLGGYSQTSNFLAPAAIAGSGGTSNTQNIIGGVAAAGSLYDLLRRAGVI